MGQVPHIRLSGHLSFAKDSEYFCIFGISVVTATWWTEALRIFLVICYIVEGVLDKVPDLAEDGLFSENHDMGRNI